MKAKISPYAHIDTDRQKVRALWALMLLGKRCLKLPEISIDGKTARKLQRNLDQICSWHEKAIAQMEADQPEKKYPRHFAVTLARYARFDNEAGLGPNELILHRASLFIAASLLINDGIISCPAVCRNRTWRYLNDACSKLDEFYSEMVPESFGLALDYVQVVGWKAERKETQ